MHRLTIAKVKAARPGDKLSDGAGLRLDVDRHGNAAWIFRFTSPVLARERFMGLGPLGDISLADARDAAAEARTLLRQGKDPIEARREARAAVKVAAGRSISLKAFAESFIAAHEATWSSQVHRSQWRNTLRDYVYPKIGHLPVSDVDTAAVLSVLRPIWNEKPETASRLRGRLEVILSAAKVEGLRTGDNPAQWRGHLKETLPSRREVRSVVHHPALPYQELPAFMVKLEADGSDSARLLRFIILTAARYSEAAKMEPDEVKGDVWTVPASRMKAGKSHQVPLSSAALECLPVPRASDVSLLNCIARHTETPATTHGFRSTFRDWVGDCTSFAREVAEEALAHTIAGETERAYRRGSALIKRRELMQAWATFCTGAAT